MFPMMINMSNGILVNVLDALNKRMSLLICTNIYDSFQYSFDYILD